MKSTLLALLLAATPSLFAGEPMITPAGVPGFGPGLPIGGIDPISDRLVYLTKLQTAAYSSLNLLVESDLSCLTSADCDSVALGSRACGGPEAFAVVSKLNPFHADGVIASLAAKTEEFGGEINDLAGAISICSIEMPPAVRCVQNRCSN
jgi:hypothetical protein